MCRQRQVVSARVAPQESGRQVHGIEGAERSGEGLSRPAEHRPRGLHHFHPACEPVHGLAPDRQIFGCQALADAQAIEGAQALDLYKGGVHVNGRRSPVSLYSEAMSSFEDAGEADTYDQRDAEGFIRLQGLRLPHVDAD